MHYHKISFFMYLWADPYLRSMLFVLAGAVIFDMFLAAWMVSMNCSMAEEISDQELDEAPRRVYAFSRQGEVEIYGDRALILRNGTCVSSPFMEIWDVSWNDSRDDRVLYVKHMGPDGPVTEPVHCGPMDIFEAMKVRDMLLHYMGG